MGFVQFLNCFGCLVAACSAARAEMAADSLILSVLFARGAETSELGNRERFGAIARRSIGLGSAAAGGAVSSTFFLGFSGLGFSSAIVSTEIEVGAAGWATISAPSSLPG